MGNIFKKNTSTKFKEKKFRIYTFGDSILDCGGYNEYGVNPGSLLVKNEDSLFPEFIGRDLSTILGTEVELNHMAMDGSLVNNLQKQLNRANLGNL